jgi:hypothetical protein
MKVAFLGVTAEVNLMSLSFPRATFTHKRGSAIPYQARHTQKIEVNGGKVGQDMSDEFLRARFSSSLLMRHRRMSSTTSVGSVLIVTAILVCG